MFIALYRWKLKTGQEKRFQEGWRRITEKIYRKNGSLGSRLHKAEDGTWVAYAQWTNKETWESRSNALTDLEALAMFRESIEISQPEIYMEVVDDLFQPNTFIKDKHET